MAVGPFAFGLMVEVAGYPIAWACLLLPVVAASLPLLRLAPFHGGG